MIRDNLLTRTLVIAFLTSLRLLAPLSVLYFALTLATAYLPLSISFLPPAQPILFVYATLESLCLPLYFIAKRNILDNHSLPDATPLEQVRAMLTETLDGLEKHKGEDETASRRRLDNFLGGWFEWIGEGKKGKAAEAKDLCRGDVEDLLASIFFTLPLSQIYASPPHHSLLLTGLNRLELLNCYRFPSGRSSKIRLLQPHLDPSTIEHRPLALYGLAALCSGGAHLALWAAGFRYRRRAGRSERRMGYYWRMPKEGEKRRPGWMGKMLGMGGEGKEGEARDVTPLILIHGIGGLTSIFHLLLALTTTSRPIYCLDTPNVSLRLMPSLLFPRSLISFVLWSSPLSRRSTSRANEQHHALTVAEVIVSTRQMLAETGLTEGTQSMFVAHSLGTGLVSSIAREAPDLIVGSVLIDPISILLFHPHLVRGFVHSPPSSAFSHLLRFLGREIHICHYLSKHISWAESSLSLTPLIESDETTSKRIPHHVVLSELDSVAPVKEITRHCRKLSVPCTVLPSTGHGGFLTSLSQFKTVLGLVTSIPTPFTDSSSLSTMPKLPSTLATVLISAPTSLPMSFAPTYLASATMEPSFSSIPTDFNFSPQTSAIEFGYKTTIISPAVDRITPLPTTGSGFPLSRSTSTNHFRARSAIAMDATAPPSPQSPHRHARCRFPTTTFSAPSPTLPSSQSLSAVHSRAFTASCSPLPSSPTGLFRQFSKTPTNWVFQPTSPSPSLQKEYAIVPCLDFVAPVFSPATSDSCWAQEQEDEEGDVKMFSPAPKMGFSFSTAFAKGMAGGGQRENEYRVVSVKA